MLRYIILYYIVMGSGGVLGGASRLCESDSVLARACEEKISTQLLHVGFPPRDGTANGYAKGISRQSICSRSVGAFPAPLSSARPCHLPRPPAV